MASTPLRPRSPLLSIAIATATPAMTASSEAELQRRATRPARRRRPRSTQPATAGRPVSIGARHRDQRQDRGEFESPARRESGLGQQDAERSTADCHDIHVADTMPTKNHAAPCCRAPRWRIGHNARRRSPRQCRPSGSRSTSRRTSGKRPKYGHIVAEKTTKRRLTMPAVSRTSHTGAPATISGSDGHLGAAGVDQQRHGERLRHGESSLDHRYTGDQSPDRGRQHRRRAARTPC